MKIYFLTRSLYPYQKSGGAQIRNAQIDTLKRFGYDVVVVMPDYENNSILITDNEIKIPFLNNHKFVTLLEMIGVYEDYLDSWVKKAFNVLQNLVKKEDLLFATSGGELGMIKLSVILKKEIGCSVVANFHDPLVYSLVHGYRLKHRFHVSRERVEERYLKEVDYVITSSENYKDSLLKKYQFLENRVDCIYFGYIKKLNIKNKANSSEFLNIAYAGYMSKAQQPEMMLDLLDYNKNIKLYFIGDRATYLPLQNIENDSVEFIDYLPHNEFLEFMSNRVDIGFVSLSQNYFGACIPSKIYEYINLQLPIFGILPKGDAQDIINDNGYGIAVDLNNSNKIREAVKIISDKNNLDFFRNNIKRDKTKWLFQEQYKRVDDILNVVLKRGQR